MAEPNGPYAKDMAYLQDKANHGTLTHSNAIYQKLDGKRNVPEVNAFLNHIASKMK